MKMKIGYCLSFILGYAISFATWLFFLNQVGFFNELR